MQDLVEAARRVINNLSHPRGPITDCIESPEGLREVVTKYEARPTIVCLCGSTRFWRTFQEAGLRETLAGRIVLSIGAASGTDDQHFGNLPKEEYDAVKEMLDQLHLRKVELADECLILNVDGYVGPSTSRELAYARKLGKVVRFWEEESDAAS